MKREFTKKEVKGAKREYKKSLTNKKKHNEGRIKLVDRLMQSKVPNFNLRFGFIKD